MRTKNNSPIRVLYKKQGQPAEVKIIDNVFRLKKAIIQKQLSIIPYHTLYIICNNKNMADILKPNIVLDFNSIYGDLILVDIDKKKREFKAISQEDIIWYFKDLNYKSYGNLQNTNSNNSSHIIKNNMSSNTKVKYIKDYERCESSKGYINNSNDNYNNNYSTQFEKQLIDVLVNIELVLASILRNGDLKNE